MQNLAVYMLLVTAFLQALPENSYRRYVRFFCGLLLTVLLASKGFQDAVVSLTEESADVVVDVADLSDAKRAQIEDIVTRKAEVNAANVVITPIHESTNTSESGD